jgi:methyltransferase-like protein
MRQIKMDKIESLNSMYYLNYKLNFFYRIASEKTHGLNRGMKTSVRQVRGFITLLSNTFLKTYLQTYIRMVNYHKLHILDSLKCENQAVELFHTVIEPWGSRG